MSTEQHEAPTKRCRCPALAEAYAKLQEKSLAQHALIVQMAGALRPLAAIAINCATEIAPNGYANPEDWRRDVEKARDSRAAATQYLTQGPET